jgi:TetR/AcrR family transcriptional regulator, transcriptional repressor for nem operon
MDAPLTKKQRTRDRIVRSAAKAFRAGGYASTGVDKVMSDAGLTAGGFYAHFKSKDELLVEAFALAAREALDSRLDPTAARKEAAQCFIASYLSEAHRDGPAAGCPFAALGPELARGGKGPRAHAAMSLAELLHELEAKLELRHDQAQSLFALCLGGLVLSRVASSAAESGKMLDACRGAAKQMIGRVKRSA